MKSIRLFFLSNVVLGLLAVWVLSGCVQSGQLDINGQLKISPDVKSITIVETKDSSNRCIYDAGYYLDMPVVISMVDSLGYAQGDTPVSVYVDYSENTFSGPPTLSLYADSNGNGVIDDPDELVSGFDHDIFQGTTSRYNAELYLLLRINLSCAFTGQVTAISGPMTGALSIDLTAASTTDESHPDEGSAENTENADDAVLNLFVTSIRE